MNKSVLIPLPSYGFDPTETAIPWKYMIENNIQVTFASPDGKKAQTDIRMLLGKGLGIWKPLLMSRKDAVAAYYQMENSESFCRPLAYSQISESDFDAILLPGGHDKAVKIYLESPKIKDTVVDFFKSTKPVGAICHGVLIVAESIDPHTKRSVIFHYKTTSLLQSQELLAYYLTRWWLKDYYLTYPGHTVEIEVKKALSDKSHFLNGPIPIFRDDVLHTKRGFLVRDKNYLSARWPGDVHAFSLEWLRMLAD